jgi:hypothetical protein
MVRERTTKMTSIPTLSVENMLLNKFIEWRAKAIGSVQLTSVYSLRILVITLCFLISNFPYPLLAQNAQNFDGFFSIPSLCKDFSTVARVRTWPKNSDGSYPAAWGNFISANCFMPPSGTAFRLLSEKDGFEEIELFQYDSPNWKSIGVFWSLSSVKPFRR